MLLLGLVTQTSVEQRVELGSGLGELGVVRAVSEGLRDVDEVKALLFGDCLVSRRSMVALSTSMLLASSSGLGTGVCE